MVVKIKDKEIELRQTFRSLMIYEKIVGETFAGKGVTEMMIYFYSTVLASDKDLELSFDDFIEYVDENPNLLNEFTMWLQEIAKRNQPFKDDTTKDDTEPKIKKKKHTNRVE